MGGPAMIEGGGLGIYTPEEVGPMSFQVPNGVVDILVKDEDRGGRHGEEVSLLLPGRDRPRWEAHDQRRLRHAVPENRLRLYDMRAIVHTIADKGSVLEIRAEVRHRHHHRLRPHRGPADGRDRQQSASPGGRDRLRRCRQGRALHAALRRLRHPGAEPDRLPGHHGRPGGRAHGAGAPLHAAVQRGRQHDRAAVHRGRAQGLRSRRAGDAAARARWSASSPSPGLRPSSPA